MADNKRGRDEQADNADRRQRERDIVAQLERGDETEPPIDEAELDELEAELSEVAFPVTGAELVDAAGDAELGSPTGANSLAELIPETDTERFDSPKAVRTRIQRPTIAAAMKRIVEAAGPLPNKRIGDSQREAYEKTLRALKAIDADDDDEGIAVITDWIVDRIREDETLPGSRDVRRQAAEFCRSNGYRIRNDEWLGV